MTNQIKVAVVGGTGKAGKYLVRELLRRGYQLRLLLRKAERFGLRAPGIELVLGDARDAETVTAFLSGCGAVVSAIGQPKGEPSIFSQATCNIVGAMKVHGIRRYILLTGLQVDTPFDKKSEKVAAATQWMKENFPETTADKQAEYDFLIASGVDWTLLRLPWIDLTDERRGLSVSFEDCAGDKVGAADLAGFVADQLQDSTWMAQAPFVADRCT